MLTLFIILHFLGASLLIGGEPLVAIIAIKAEKDDNVLRFFSGFIGNVAAFMWTGVILALIGGAGMYLTGTYPFNALFIVKMILFALVIFVSILLLVNIPQVQRTAKKDLANLRHTRNFKQMDMFSKIDMLLIFAILIVSVVIYG